MLALRNKPLHISVEMLCLSPSQRTYGSCYFWFTDLMKIYDHITRSYSPPFLSSSDITVHLYWYFILLERLYLEEIRLIKCSETTLSYEIE